MKFKFNTGDHVSFVFGSVYSPNAYGAYQAVVNGGKIIARKGCGSSGGPEYRVSGFSGWWPEEYLVLVSRSPENLSWQDEGSEPTTNTQNETKCDTGDSGEPGSKWYRISFSAKLTAEDLRAMKKCFFDAMNESMEIYDLDGLVIEEA